MPLPPDARITIGLVRGLHGLQGAVRVEVLTDAADRFAVGSTLFVDGEVRPVTVAWTGPTRHGLLVRFAELTTRASVEGLRERYLEAIADEPLPEDSWYWHEIIGLAARTSTGEDLGTVIDVFRAGGGEVYVVSGGARGEVLVPAVRTVVVELSPEAGHLVVDAVALGLADPAPGLADPASVDASATTGPPAD